MSLLRPLGLAALMALVAAPALASEPDFPATTDPVGLAAWLGAQTNIKPASVVAITPGFVVALAGEQKPLSPEGPVRVTLREEVIAPAFVDAVGGRSALMSVDIQCDERRLRMDGRNLYAGPNLSGQKSIDEPSTEWLRIPEDTVMDEVADAACNGDYAWPLRNAAPSPTVVAEQGAPLPAPPPIIDPSPPEAVIEEAKAEEPPPAAEVAKTLVAEVKAEKPAEPSAPDGRYAIQIGAYRTQQLAQNAWNALSTERPVLTQGHDFDTRPVKVKGKDLLRGLVLNFKSPEAGAAFCTALAGTGYGCILRVLPD